MLTLRERVAVLKSIDSRKSGHSVAQEFNVGKTQIQGIVGDREEIVRKLEAGECSGKKYSKVRKTGYKELDEVVWELFTRRISQ